MKILRFALPLILASASTLAFAQPSYQDAFDKLKTLDGAWQGTLSTTPQMPDTQGKVADVKLHTSSMGNALMHEMSMPGRKDDPITMFYMDEGRLLLTHYCDAGNRPRMVGKLSPDGKTVEFEFLDVAGNTEEGHMHHAVFTLIDENHHNEDWTFMMGDQPVRAHFELHRVK